MSERADGAEHSTCRVLRTGTRILLEFLTDAEELGKTALEMSGASEGDSHAAHAHGPPPLPEPETPMWLTVVGVVLFLMVGLLWGLSAPPAP